MNHNTILCCKDIDTTHMTLILNHMCYKVNANSSKDNGAGKQAEVKNLDSTLAISVTS